MNAKILLSAGAIVGGLCLAAPTSLANDCCWDWSPLEAGAQDVPPPGPPPADKPASAFAQCTSQLTQADCFARDGRQQFWGAYVCFPGGGAPDTGSANTGDGAGWVCVLKNLSPPQISLLKVGLPSDPVSGLPTTEGIIVPTVSEWGLIVMGLLILTGGTIAIRRGRATAPAMA